MSRGGNRKISASARLSALALALLAAPAFGAPANGADAPTQPAGTPDAFALTATETGVERDAPEICAIFTKIPDPEQQASLLATLTTEDGAAVPVNFTRRGRSLCLNGMEHGRRYRLSLSADLKSDDGRPLSEAVDRVIDVAERKPSLAFRDAGFLLARIGDGRADGDLALRSINVASATVRLLRLADADGLERAYFEAGDPALVDRLAKDAREVWSGGIALSPTRNRAVTTPVPLTAIAGKLEPGVYVAAAEAESGERSQQWFIVSDLGVNTVIGDDGLLVFTRSRATAAPIENVVLRVAARDRSEAAQTRTGADGLARIDAAQLAGANERTPQVLLARRGADVAVVELSGPRNALGAEPDENPFQRSRLDAFVGVDRPVYAPGDTVHAVALLRDTDGREAVGEPLLAELRRPDGALAARVKLDDAGGGGYVFSLRLPGVAQAGDWKLSLHEEASDEAVGETTLRVDDARPLGLRLSLDAATIIGEAQGGAESRPAARLTLQAAGATGRPAAGLSGQAFVSARHPQAVAAGPLAGFVFFQSMPASERQPLGSFVTDADGRATLQSAFPDELPLRSAFDVRIEAEVAVAGALAARAETTTPYWPRPIAVGLRPRFDGAGVPEGATVAFDVTAVDGASGQPVEAKGLTYELVREEAAFEWFDNHGRWDYRAVARERPTAGGVLDVSVGAPALISEPVGAGSYRLVVRDPASGAVASHRFAAGWWMSPQAGSRPDRVEVSAIRPGPRAEGKAWVFIRPPYAGEVLILVADQRVRRAETRAIGADGAFIEIPSEYGARAGAHVVAVAFAAPDPAYRGPPRRAAGSTWLPALDGPHRLTASLAAAPAPEAASGALTLKLTARNDRRGGDGANDPIHAVAALLPVVAAPEAFGDPARHFFGERPLGVSVRDIFGKLISPPDRKTGSRDDAAAGRATPQGAIWVSANTRLNQAGEATFVVTPPPGTPAGNYRAVALVWDSTAMGRVETLTAVAGAADAAPLQNAVASTATAWRRIWGAEVAPESDAALPEGAAGLLLSESAGTADLDIGEAAGKLTARLPPLGAHAAAARLSGLAALRLQGFDRERTAVAALDELLATQRPDGAFAAWSAAGPADPWLTAYALDAMGRWRRSGGEAPETAATAARDWLRRWWDGCWSDPGNLSSCAYALAMLTEAKKLDAGAVAFFADSFAAQLPSELARAHLAAAYDNVGDRRAAEAALARVAGGRRVDAATRDYGSAIRDAAAAVAIMAERRAPAEMLSSAAARLLRTRATAFSLNDQEAAWLLAAAAALTPANGAPPKLAPFNADAGPVRNASAAPVRFSLLAPADPPADAGGARLTQSLTNVIGDALTVTLEAVFEPEDRPKLFRLSAPLPDGVQALTAPAAVNGDDKQTATALLRARADSSGVTAVAQVPPGVGRLKVSYLLRVVGAGDVTAPPAVLEPLTRGGRAARVVSAPLPIAAGR